MAGQCLVGPLGVVVVVELVNLGLQFPEGLGEGLFVEPSEQGLVEPFVLALGLGMVGLAGDRFDAEGFQVGDERSLRAASSGGVERGAVVGEQALGDADGALPSIAAIRCLTLTGPQSSPAISSARLVSRARETVSSSIRVGLDLGFLLAGWMAAACPCSAASRRIRWKDWRDMPWSRQNEVTLPLGAPSGHCAIARRTFGSIGFLVFFASLLMPPRKQTDHVRDKGEVSHMS